MTTATVFSVMLILLSPAIGSFLGVLADRLPRGQDIVSAPSRCRACKHRLGVRELVPIVSFIGQRGRCRACSAPIPPFTLYIEVLAVGAAVLAVLAGGPPLVIGITVLWLWLLITLAASDLMWFRLPDPLTGALFAVAVGLALMPQGIGISAALWGAALGAGSFAALRWSYFRLRGRAGLGLGDVKLIAGLGAFSGPLDLPLLVLIAAIAALGFALATRTTAGGLSATRPLPFGTALCFAAAIIWLVRMAA